MIKCSAAGLASFLALIVWVSALLAQEVARIEPHGTTTNRLELDALAHRLHAAEAKIRILSLREAERANPSRGNLRRLPTVETQVQQASYEQPMHLHHDGGESPISPAYRDALADGCECEPPLGGAEDNEFIDDGEWYGCLELLEGGRGPIDNATAFFSSSKDFEEGIVIHGTNAVMKIGGFVKVDLIYDFDPIDSTDLFDTTSIPVGAAPRQNFRAHARQSRLSFDTRWPSDDGPVRVFVEGDFFSDGDRLQLRHAYGEQGGILVGKTWTTFTDTASIPTTLDFEGSISAVTRRQAQVRWTRAIYCEDLALSVAVEDPRVLIDPSLSVLGDERTVTPDLVARLRYSPLWGQVQVAGVFRKLGFQPTGMNTVTSTGWGFNFTGVIYATGHDNVYSQILFGEGIGSYRSLPDVAPTGPNAASALGTFGWMIGWTHAWTDRLSSNFTYAESRIDNTTFQDPGDLHLNTYLAVNLIWNPSERMFVGIEYLFGARENINGVRGEANRIQTSFGFYLP